MKFLLNPCRTTSHQPVSSLSVFGATALNSTLTVSGTATFGSSGGFLQTGGGDGGARAGYLGFYTSDSTRRGYIGWGDGGTNLQLVGETGYGWQIEANLSVIGVLTASNTLSVSGATILNGTLTTSSACVDASFIRSNPASGATITVPLTTSHIAIVATGITSFTITMPGNASNGQMLRVSTASTITGISWNGGTVNSPAATISSGQSVLYTWDSIDGVWLRVQ